MIAEFKDSSASNALYFGEEWSTHGRYVRRLEDINKRLVKGAPFMEAESAEDLILCRKSLSAIIDICASIARSGLNGKRFHDTFQEKLSFLNVDPKPPPFMPGHLKRAYVMVKFSSIDDPEELWTLLSPSKLSDSGVSEDEHADFQFNVLTEKIMGITSKRLFNEAASALQSFLPQDCVAKFSLEVRVPSHLDACMGIAVIANASNLKFIVKPEPQSVGGTTYDMPASVDIGIVKQLKDSLSAAKSGADPRRSPPRP